jgi:hypothetical protein
MFLLYFLVSLFSILGSVLSQSSYWNILLEDKLNPKLKVNDFSRNNSQFSIYGQRNSEISNISLTLNSSVDELLKFLGNYCNKYISDEFLITNCSFSILSYQSQEEMLFDLFYIEAKDLNNSNLKSYFLEEKTNSEEKINIYPEILKNMFSFDACSLGNCANWTDKNLTDFNQFSFNLSTSSEIEEKYEIYLESANIIVKNDDALLIYFQEVTSFIKNMGNIYVFSLNTLPDEFDLHLIYKLRRKWDKNFTKEDVKFL